MMKIGILVVAGLLLCGMVFAQSASDKIGGLVFYDYSYQMNKEEDNNEFELRRVYFTYTRALSDRIVYKFQTDVGRTGNDDRLTAYLKNAKVDWKTAAGTITIGLQGMNIFNVQEKNWGYRFIEKSAMDQRTFASSADLGIGFARSFSKNVHFSLLATNGRGYKHSENDSYKKVSTQLFYGSKKIVGKDGYNVGVILTYEPYDLAGDAGVKTKQSKSVTGVFAGMTKGKVRIGADYDLLKDNGLDITKSIISVYGILAVQPNLNLFARFDQWDPNTTIDDDGESYIIAGVDYLPVKGFYIAPNFRLINPQIGDVVKMVKVNFQVKF